MPKSSISQNISNNVIKKYILSKNFNLKRHKNIDTIVIMKAEISDILEIVSKQNRMDCFD